MLPLESSCCTSFLIQWEVTCKHLAPVINCNICEYIHIPVHEWKQTALSTQMFQHFYKTSVLFSCVFNKLIQMCCRWNRLCHCVARCSGLKNYLTCNQTEEKSARQKVVLTQSGHVLSFGLLLALISHGFLNCAVQSHRLL